MNNDWLSRQLFRTPIDVFQNVSMLILRRLNINRMNNEKCMSAYHYFYDL